MNNGINSKISLLIEKHVAGIRGTQEPGAGWA